MQTNPSPEQPNGHSSAPDGDTSHNADAAPRDFSTISPSAFTLLLMKGLTPIPYARQAAELLLASRPNAADPIAVAKATASNPGTSYPNASHFSASNPNAPHPSTSNPTTPNPGTSAPTTSHPTASQASAPNPNATPQPPNPFDTEHRPPLFWARLLHFENRYWNIDQLMQSLDITNILELSSGFSFRGLALSREKPVYYIDTDLPDLIATKQQFVSALTREPHPTATNGAGNPAAAANVPETNTAATTTPETNTAATATAENNTAAANVPETNAAAAGAPENTPGHYELLPLNVLDAPAFQAIAHRFPPGPLLIVNEGLLVYLDQAEKEALCQTIHSILRQRGGYWITGDIYIQKELDPSLIDREDSFHQFLQHHNVEEKKFPDFERAAEFFTRMGFIVDREAAMDVSRLSALPRLLAAISPETQKKLTQTPKMHATWRLRVAGS